MGVMTDDELPVSAAGGEGDPPGPPAVSGRQLRELLADESWLDELIDRAGQGGVRLTGSGGFLPELVKAVLERGWPLSIPWKRVDGTVMLRPVDRQRHRFGGGAAPRSR